MALCDKLQLHDLSSRLTSWLQPQLATLACQPDTLSNIMAYARDNIERNLLLQLLTMSLHVAASAAQAVAAAAGGSNGMNGSVNHAQGFNGGAVSGSKSRSHDGHRRQRRRTNDWVMGEDEAAAEQDLAHVLGLDMLPSVNDDSPSSSDQNQYNDGGYGDSATSSLGSPGSSVSGKGGSNGIGTEEMQQRLAMCMSSGLFGPAGLNTTAAAGAMAAPAAPSPAAGAAPVVASAPLVSAAPTKTFQQQQQQVTIPRMSAMGFPMPFPPSRSRPAAPCLESVMEVDGGEQQQQQQQFTMDSSGWAAKLLPGERRRSLAF
jgi:hypothetical protein